MSKTAVVMGGSLAGLMAARVLTERFEQVIVLERDRCLPSAPHASVPQAHHVHVLLLRGLQILDALFPGFSDELIREGGLLLDSARDFHWFTPAGWAPRFTSGLPFLAVSRPLLESTVRRRVAQLSAVSMREGASATGLSIDKSLRRITGVCAEPDGFIPASLVIDAMGRASHLPKWLERLGYARPVETAVDGHLAYSSRIYRREHAPERDWQGAFSQAAPPDLRRTGVALPIEGDRWMVTLAGGGKDYPPIDEAGFAAFAKSLPNPGIHEVIANSIPLSSIYSHRGTQNRLRHYDRIRMPAGLLVTGDAACCFNPVYGQGMSTAAIGALLLQDCLKSERFDRFQHKLASHMQPAWLFATSEDVRYPGAEGATLNLKMRLMHRYIDGAIRLSVGSTRVRACFLRVLHMLAQPSLLFRPDIMLRVLFQSGGYRCAPLTSWAERAKNTCGSAVRPRPGSP